MEGGEEVYHRGGFKLKKPLPILPDSKVIDVTCGVLKGRLHRELFLCPGIRRECIELEDGEFVTPKRFMFMGEKARLKDWKNAVRIQGVQVRKYIDAGDLTFFNHETTCTGRCQARIPFNKYNAASSPSPTGIPQPTELLTTTNENGLMQIQNIKSGDHVVWDGTSYPQEEDIEDVKPDLQQLQLQMLGNVNQAQKQIQNTLASAAVKQMPMVQVAPPSMVSYPEGQPETTDEEDRLLWKGIVELGLVDEFFREIKASLDILKNNMVRRMIPVEDTRKISVVVKQLGLMSKLKYKLEAHQTDMERQRLRLDREMEELQRKVREYELKKELLKRKSDCFNQLIDMTKKEQDFIPEPKRHCSNGPSEIVFPSSFPVRNVASDRGAASDSSNDTNSTNSRSTPTESRRKQKTTEKIVPNYSLERDSIELEYVNGHDYVDDIEEGNVSVSNNISAYHSEVPIGNPEVPIGNPEIPIRNSEIQNRNPEVPSTNPEVPSINSEVPIRNPEVPIRNPDLPIRSPRKTSVKEENRKDSEEEKNFKEADEAGQGDVNSNATDSEGAQKDINSNAAESEEKPRPSVPATKRKPGRPRKSVAD